MGLGMLCTEADCIDSGFIDSGFIEELHPLLRQTQSMVAMPFDPNDGGALKIDPDQSRNQSFMCNIASSDWLVFRLPCPAIT